jgi:hypothetical protein
MLRVTISEPLAEILLELFRETLEAGGGFDQKSLDDYDKFRNSVVKAKRHKVRLRSVTMDCSKK